MELKKEILKEGRGERIVKNGDRITVHYSGFFPDGGEFDSSLDRGVPFDFTVGAGMVIQGWDEGLLGMKEGEKIKLIVPSEKAYGQKGAGHVIPPNADLIFEVELISIA